MNKRNVLIIGRLFFGAIVITAIAAQLAVHIASGYNVVNFFSYFTNISNLLAAAILLASVFLLISHRAPTPLQDMMRGASVVYMTVVGVVFSLLLRNVELGSLLPWVNIVLHYVMPVVVVADWLYQPAHSKISFGRMGYWLVFPFVYLVYSLIRGSLTGFYAYPFISPTQPGGYSAVSLYCIVILIIFLLASTLVMWVSNRRSTTH